MPPPIEKNAKVHGLVSLGLSSHGLSSHGLFSSGLSLMVCLRGLISHDWPSHGCLRML
ncbi:hypothetical protein GXP70_24140 [Paenibacillus lycopersici]|uniref:Uncharacterized protein n=1 Tax=Paenibacillus lycopersici TaxID=2704462 RepID=A0A6C0G077_9BACL|nr:hypothetical protein GXP70_24140 [Paenibacillus lycopersici]